MEYQHGKNPNVDDYFKKQNPNIKTRDSKLTAKMNKLFFSLVLLTSFALTSCDQKSKVDNTLDTSNNSKADSSGIIELIKKYGEAIDKADTLLASKLFAHTNEVSFIHPRGHEKGWSEVNSNIYKFFGDTFSKRKLNIFSENVTVYNNVAWVEFYWTFDATFKKDNSPLQTKGRETQIWRKIDNEWHLVHVHYSNMPVTGEGQGF